MIAHDATRRYRNLRLRAFETQRGNPYGNATIPDLSCFDVDTYFNRYSVSASSSRRMDVYDDSFKIRCKTRIESLPMENKFPRVQTLRTTDIFHERIRRPISLTFTNREPKFAGFFDLEKPIKGQEHLYVSLDRSFIIKIVLEPSYNRTWLYSRRCSKIVG